MSHASAVTIRITGNTNWGSINTGSGPQGQPSAIDNIIVQKGRTLTVNVANAVCNTLTIGSSSGTGGQSGNGTLSFSASTSKVTVSGAVIIGDANQSGAITMASGGTLVAGSFTVTNLSSWTPGTGTVQLTSTNTLPATSSLTTFNNLTISAGTTTLGQNTTISGTLTVSTGTLQIGGSTLTLNGPAISGGNLSATATSSIVLGGSSIGVSLPASITTLNRITINNTNGVSLNSSLTINGTLSLTSGALQTGINLVTITANCSSGLIRTTGYIIGQLRLTYPSGTNSCTFPIGGSTAYAPVSVAVVASAAGTLSAATTGNEHPEISASGIDSTKDANRYWTIGATGDTLPTKVSSYGVTLNYIAADLDTTATATNFVVGKYANSDWALPTPVTVTATSSSVSNLPGPISVSTDFVVGETAPAACTVPSDLPAGTSCVCDTFGRASLNPSTINGGNWTLSTSSGSFGVPKIVSSGFLRLTDNSTNVSTAATLPGAFPAKGNLITVDFKHYAYLGTGAGGTGGADGIALTLSDASITPAPGAFGGSLGYAQKTGISGFAGGWIGIGIDEYGNYSTNQEGRSGGAGSALVVDSIAVRGSGAGSGATNNYAYLGGSGTLTPGIDSATSTSRALGHAYRITVDARCYQANTADTTVTCNNPSLSKKAQVSVYRDTTGAGNFSTSNRLINFDAFTQNASQANVPSQWKLSFTGSTGTQVNIHEIAAIKVCAQSISLPPLIEVDNVTPSTCSTASGGQPTVTITARKGDGSIDTTYNKLVTLSAKLSNGNNSNAVWTKLTGSGNFSNNQYQFVAADNGVATFRLTDTTTQDVYVSVTENVTGLSSSFSAPVEFNGASFSISVPAAEALGTGVVAGRPHLLTVTRNTGCGTDTTYTGTKSLDGWYNPDTNQPTGANAPQICATSNGTCLSGVGSCQTLSIAAPTPSSTTNNLPALNFTNGVANFCLKTSDVGKYSLSLRDDVSSVTAPPAGTSAVFTVRPFAIAVRNVVQGALNNPANAALSASNPFVAGSDFTATVAAYLWNSGADTGSNGRPGTTAGLASIATAGIVPSYAQTVSLAATSNVPGPGDLTGGSVAVSDGSAVATLNYSEVGSFSLSASVPTNYLSTAGVDLNNRIVVFSNPTSDTRTAIVGRFRPYKFVLVDAATPVQTRSDLTCAPASDFSYMGEPMTVRFNLSAQNAKGAQTVNYAGSYARFSNVTPYANWTSVGTNDSVGLWMVGLGYPVGTGSCRVRISNATPSITSYDQCVDGATAPSTISRAAGPRIAITSTPASPSIIWSGGSGSFSANVIFDRADSVDGPYSALKIGILPRDADGVTLDSADLDIDTDAISGNDRASIGTTAVRFGRLKLANAHGSELLNIRMPVEAQYWNGTGFVTNTLDSCTAIAGTAVTMNNYSKNLAECETKLAATSALTGGVGYLILSAPGAGNNGSVDLKVNLGSTASGNTCVTASTSASFTGWSYLKGNWLSAPYTDDPTARATFGVFKSGPIIYIREIH